MSVDADPKLPHDIRPRLLLHRPTTDRSLVVLYAGMAVVFLYLTYRGLGLYAGVMSDELSYSMYSRFKPFSTSPIPSYLYFWIFRQTRHCGDGFLDCARVLNSLFWVGAAPFVYAIARRVTTPSLAAYVALLSIIGPANSYTTYFMPEAMYFFGFWVLSYVLFCFRGSAPVRYGCWLGVVVACLSMVKVHALFLLPGVVVAVVADEALTKRPGAKNRVVLIVSGLLVTAALGRLGAGYLFAGRAGLHVLGAKYGAVADTSLSLGTLLGLGRNAAVVLCGHFMGLALLFGIPVVSLFFWKRSGEPGERAQDLVLLKIYTLTSLGFLFLVTAYYSASVVGQANEALGRMHQRYYNFALPLLFIVAVGELHRSAQKIRNYFSIPLAVIVGGFAIASLWVIKAIYVPGLVDSPEIRGATMARTTFYSIGISGAILLATWIFNRRLAVQLFVFVLMPFSVLASTHNASSELRPRVRPNLAQQAGQFTHDALPFAERGKVMVVGSDEISLCFAIFQIDSPGARFRVVPEAQPVDLSTLPPGFDWILVLGNHSTPAGLEFRFPMDGYALFRLSKTSGME